MKRERGVALLTAMLIVTLVAIIGTSMITRMNYAMHRSGNLWLHQKAWSYALGVEQWVGTILQRDARKTDIDTLKEIWSRDVGVLPIEGGAISGRIIDLQGRFNINSLAGAQAEQAMAQFRRLITLVAERIDPISARTIVQSTRDWIDSDRKVTRPYGAEDYYYLGVQPAYRTGNRLMVTASTLRAVRGMTPKLFRALAPHITALPEPTPINVNTATAAVLASLAPRLSLDTAKALIEQRKEQPWESVGAFLEEDALAGIGGTLKPERLSVSSHFFGVTGSVTMGRIRLDFHSVLARGKSGSTRVVRHSRIAH